MKEGNNQQTKYRLRLNLSKKLNYPLVKPERITLVINHYCNLKCIMCDLWETNDNREMTEATAKKIIDEMQVWGVDFLHFTGGEPLFHKHFFELVNYAGERGITTEVNTNAALPEEVAEKILSSSLDRLNISLDGAKAETHDYIRGKKGTFDKAIRLIDTINKRRANADSKPMLIITCTIMDQNLEELAAIVDFARENLFMGISFGVVTTGLVNLKPGLESKTSSHLPGYWVPPSRYNVLEEAINTLISIKKKDPGIIHNTLEYLMLIKDYFKMNLPNKTNNCFAGFNNLHIDPSGNIGTCGGLFGNTQKPLWKTWKSITSYKTRFKVLRCRRPCLAGCHTNTGAENLKKILADLWESRRQY